eukprot:jgi/Phyca11/14366/fgenesh1_pg.PHYCAscaffold_7_\
MTGIDAMGAFDNYDPAASTLPTAEAGSEHLHMTQEQQQEHQRRREAALNSLPPNEGMADNEVGRIMASGIIESMSNTVDQLHAAPLVGNNLNAEQRSDRTDTTKSDEGQVPVQMAKAIQDSVNGIVALSLVCMVQQFELSMQQDRPEV